MSVIQPVILSGGSGTRMWPVSRSMLPKQLLPLVSDRTMLQETVARLQGVPANMADKVIVVCSEAHRFLVAAQLEELGIDATIVLEPEGRNTAPAVALAAELALKNVATGAEAPVLLVLPADHEIRNSQRFHDAIVLGAEAASAEKLVTFGIVPTEPHTGYGYIEAIPSEAGAVPVAAFIEKPDLETARKLANDSKHFWNSGMFMFSATTYVQELERFDPDISAACRASVDHAKHDSDFVRPDADAFLASPSDSIDYAVMEKTEKAMMVPLDAGWSDVGSWAALHDISARDRSGNTTIGDVVLQDCDNCYVSSESKLVTAVGVSDLVVVETKDAVLVTGRKSSQDVKKLVDQLKAAERSEVSLHRQVYRPWGSYDGVDGDDGFQVKRLIVNPGAILSLQMHHRRAEHWVVVRGTARITLNDDVFDLSVNEHTHIPIGATHRIENPGDEPLHIIEVQCGDYLGEDDIVRFEDNYGREGTNT